MQEQCLTLMASAGSGKTFALTLRYLSLLFYGANASEILTLTFTKKAAAEMRERIAMALEGLAKGEESLFFKILVEEYGFNREDILKKAPKIFERFLNCNTKITTLDAFFNFIVRKFCWNVGLSKNFVIKEQDIHQVNHQFLSLLDSASYQEFLEFCFRYENPLRIFDFLQRVSSEIMEFQEASFAVDLKDLEEDILQSSMEIKQKIANMPKASTKAKEIIKTTSLKEMLASPKWLLDGDEYFYFKKLELNMNPEFEAIRQKVALYFKIKESIIFSTMSRFKEVYKKARNILNIKSASLSFFDVTLKAYEVLVENFDRDFFYFRLDDKISHILLDEFQDTNALQYEILLPLIEELRSGEGRLGERSLFFVGDKKQSIYGFRGSDSSIFDRVTEYTTTKSLESNYRSQSEVILFNNKVFAPIFPGYLQKVPENKEAGGYVRVFPESREVCEMLESIQQALQDLFAKGVHASDIAILCYKNSDLDLLKMHFSQIFQNVNFVTEGNLSLTQRVQPMILLEALNFSLDSLQIHLKNIVKLLGLGFETDLELPVYEESQGLSDYIFTLMKKLGICDNFAQKFLEISFDYEDRESFLEAVTKIDIDMVKEKVDGVVLMTIHGSKGLEFEHVIVCDRFSKPNHRSDNFIFVDQKLYFTQSKREDFDPVYAEVKKKDENKKKQEANNVLYVAFTRAKSSLFVVPRNNGAFEGLGLQAIEIGEIKEQIKKEEKAKSQEMLSVEQQDFGRQKDFIIKDSPKELVQKNILFGEALHYALEYGFGFGIKEEILQKKLYNHYGFYLEKEALYTILEHLKKLKNDSKIQTLCKGKQLFAEVVFVKNFRLNRMDMLLIGEEIVVLDYKSGSHQEEYIEQLQGYLDILKSHFVGQKVQGYLVYLWEQIKLQKVE
ncbi:RecB-like helicase [Helicobacter anatolicus]|uniref:RecB-like helicase n=1 Tax=Helicobacter anatolicus TaxID=2905874 RepID=UPI001E32FEFB|nr:RecB-like helicase [Helicobacter anatolicus]